MGGLLILMGVYAYLKELKVSFRVQATTQVPFITVLEFWMLRKEIGKLGIAKLKTQLYKHKFATNIMVGLFMIIYWGLSGLQCIYYKTITI